MTDEYFMMQALKEARKALGDDEVPIGAVVVVQEKIIARGYNMTERLNDPTAHAEMIALTSAFNLLGSKYLPEATLYVTVEPCLMCAGAICWSKLARIVYGADDEKNGFKKTTGTNWPFHPKTELIRGVMKEQCGQLMKDFFSLKTINMPAIKKITVTHPITGTKRQFDIAVYEPIKAAIMQSLKGSKGKTFTELSDDVVSIIRKKTPGFKGSIPWYTISIRLDLETRGIVETFTEKGVKLNRLKK